MKKILFLFLIYIMSLQANEEGCTISFLDTEKNPCSSPIEKSKITIAPIVIKETAKKEPSLTKGIEIKLRNILLNVKDYKNKNQEKRNKLLNELSVIKKEFQQYKIKKAKEIKKVKTQLYSSDKKLKNNKIELVKIKKKIKRITKKTAQEKETIVLENIKTNTPYSMHKVIRKMQPSPIMMHDTPWVEIVVENNINIYDLALQYYGNAQAYKKIYLANKNKIGNDFKIYNGMTLVIPMTQLFEEQGITLNQ